MVHNQVALVSAIYRPVELHEVNELLCPLHDWKLRSSMNLLFAHIYLKIIKLRITVIYPTAFHNCYTFKAFFFQIVRNTPTPLISFAGQHII